MVEAPNAQDGGYACTHFQTNHLALGITVEQHHHPSGGQVLLPPAKEHALTLFLGQPLNTLQWQRRRILSKI